MKELLDAAAFWLRDNYSFRDLVRLFGSLCFIAGLLVGGMLERVL